MGQPLSKFKRRVLTAVVLILIFGGALNLVYFAFFHTDGYMPGVVMYEPKEPVKRFSFNRDNLDPDLVMVNGGVRRDGIPALNDADLQFVSVDEAAEMSASERMIILNQGDELKAFALRHITLHEIYNITVGGQPIALIYCPLCDAVTVVKRQLDEHVFEFGVSGKLLNSNLVLYDRTDNAFWTQIGMKAISGPHAGKRLPHLPFEIMSLALLKERYPQAMVAMPRPQDKKHVRDYNEKYYEDYFKSDELLFGAGDDEKLAAKTRVIGLQYGAEAIAVKLADIDQADGKKVVVTIGDQSVTINYDAAKDDLRFNAAPDVAVTHTFWFAWSAFYPKTRVYGE